MKKVVLNCVPPFAVYRPSPPLSILKSWLPRSSFDSSIIYGNLLFNNIQKNFVWNNPKVLDTSNDLALYVNYIICKSEIRIYTMG
jgi:hypothetical protein